MADLAAVQARLPSMNIVDVIDAPGGGMWALGADGGVHALDGAPYLGSYWDDRMVAPVHRNDPNRRFTHIVSNTVTGGYQIVSNIDEKYASLADPNKPPGPGGETGTGGGTPPPAGAAPPKFDEEAALRGVLDQAGLGGLFDAAWKYYMGEGGGNVQAVLGYLPTTDQYKARFPGIPADWKPGQYLEYEQNVKAALSGLPPEFSQQEDIGNFLTNQWSPDEVRQAVTLAQQAVLTMPAEDRAFLAELGVNTADLTGFYLDPDKKGGDLLARKITTGRAQLGGAAMRGGIDLSAAEATGLYDIGVDAGQVAARTGELGQLAPIFSELAGETTDLGRQTQVDYLQGAGTTTGAGAAKSIEQRRRSRTATFEGGGGAAGFGQRGGGLSRSS